MDHNCTALFDDSMLTIPGCQIFWHARELSITTGVVAWMTGILVVRVIIDEHLSYMSILPALILAVIYCKFTPRTARIFHFHQILS